MLAFGLLATLLLIADSSAVVIDISHWNPVSNWANVKKSVEGVIMKATQGSSVDSTFYKNAAQCTVKGIPFGVYCYSTAKSAAQGLAEANYILSVIKGYNLSYPVYFDSEEPSTASYAKAAANAFCDQVEKAGYWAGIYASESWFNSYITNLNNHTKWVAKYGINDGQPHSKPNVSGTVALWQYTSVGKISGISGNVDLSQKLGTLGGGPKSLPKSNYQLAKEVLDGKWGNGPDRKKNLEKAGYNYNAVQAIVDIIA